MTNQNQSRRNFLKLLGAAAVVVAIPSVAVLQPTEADNAERLAEMQNLLSKMTQKFDGFSVKNKQRFIDSFDNLRGNYKKEFNEEIDPFVKEYFDDLKNFYQERLERQIKREVRND